MNIHELHIDSYNGFKSVPLKDREAFKAHYVGVSKLRWFPEIPLPGRDGKLPEHLYDVATGKSSLTEKDVQIYRNYFRWLGYKIPNRGLGDQIEKVTYSLKIQWAWDWLLKITRKAKKCSTCGQRQEKLNKIFPSKVKEIMDNTNSQSKVIGMDNTVASSRQDKIATDSIIRPGDLRNVTACITHYRRPECLQKLLASIRRFYPDLKILVEDTQGNLSSARNRLYSKCETPYILMLEEDFLFTSETKIEKLLTVLESDPWLGGVAGCTNEPVTKGTVNRGGRIWWDRDFMRNHDRCYLVGAKHPFRNFKGISHRPCSVVINFGIFRKDVFIDVPWPEGLPIMEHTTWYWQVFLDSRWQFSYVPSVTINHYRQRPSQKYNEDRNRNLSGKIKEINGCQFIRDSQSAPRLNVPNVVILSIGRTNSTIITKMAASAFSLNLGFFDKEYYENWDVRALNQATIKKGELDVMQARRALRKLPQPWIIKDPAFRFTFHHWAKILTEYDPLLVFLVKDPETVEKSYAAQGWKYSPDDQKRCAKFFNEWKGRKIQIDGDKIGGAAAMFDASRMTTHGK